VVVITAAVVAGLFTLGSPSEERERRLDQRRVRDLAGIKAATDLYWTRHTRVPESLDALTAEPGVRISTRDPESSLAYDYQRVDSLHYEVCASFAAASEEAARDPERSLWAHGAGRQCFRLEADEIDPGER
jgi:hypothetical protein